MYLFILRVAIEERDSTCSTVYNIVTSNIIYYHNVMYTGPSMVLEHPKCHHSDPELLQRVGGEGGAEEKEVHCTSNLGSWNHTKVLLWMEG